MKVSSRLRITYLIILVLPVSMSLAAETRGPDAPTGLMCELMARPDLTAVLDAQPEFGWVVNSQLPDDTQSAYQILVSSARKLLDKNIGDLWDTGKTTSTRQANIEYAGKPLLSHNEYFWKVRAWNRALPRRRGDVPPGYGIPG